MDTLHFHRASHLVTKRSIHIARSRVRSITPNPILMSLWDVSSEEEGHTQFAIGSAQHILISSGPCKTFLFAWNTAYCTEYAVQLRPEYFVLLLRIPGPCGTAVFDSWHSSLPYCSQGYVAPRCFYGVLRTPCGPGPAGAVDKCEAAVAHAAAERRRKGGRSRRLMQPDRERASVCWQKRKGDNAASTRRVCVVFLLSSAQPWIYDVARSYF